MPAGLLVMTPDPGPVTETDKEAGDEKVAPTFVSRFKTTVHLPFPEQAPDQPEKDPLEAGGAGRDTEVTAANNQGQKSPQCNSGRELVTVPDPRAGTASLQGRGERRRERPASP